ncbi:MAG: hypothetical protein U0528_03675 [Anaerolineae bacterium]
MRMTRYLLALMLILCLALTGFPTFAQSSDQNAVYSNDVLGITFQYPTTWEVREQAETQGVSVAAANDWQSISDGVQPLGLIFSVTLTTFRQLGIDNVLGFSDLLARTDSNATVAAIRIGEASGVSAESQSTDADVVTRTVMLATGGRRVAVIRGLATSAGWQGGGAQQFEQILNSISFAPAEVNAGLMRVGTSLWSLATPDLTQLADLTISADGATLYATDGNGGIFTLGAAGTRGDVIKPEGVSSFGSLILLRNGQQYLSDPVSGAIWLLPAAGANGAPRKYIGAKGNVFSQGSPRYFSVRSDGGILALDVSADGTATHVFVFNRGGTRIDSYDAVAMTGMMILDPVFAAEPSGRYYLAGSNTSGILRFRSDGVLDQAGIGADLLANTAPLAMLVDRFDNLLVATADRGILKFDPEGKIIGVIGESYDQSAPPKAGQLGHPVAMIMNADANTLYVADAGAFPQIVAFALDNNLELNLSAGTQVGTKIIYGESKSATISNTTFVYEYVFTGRRNDVVTITVQAADPTQLDTFVELLSPKAKRLVFSDDAGIAGLAPSDSQIAEYTLPAGGDYTIRVTRFGRETTAQTGAFTLHLALIED